MGPEQNVKIKITLSKDEVRILIRILVGYNIYQDEGN